MVKQKILQYSEPIVLMLSFLSLIGIFFQVRDGSGLYNVVYISLFMVPLLVYPGLMAWIGRDVISKATPRNIPVMTFPILFLYTFVPTLYFLVPYVFSGYYNNNSTELLFIMFEFSVFAAGIGFFAFQMKKVKDKKIKRRDFNLYTVYLFGGLIYFYFIRLTFIAMILLQSTFDILA